MSANKRRRLNKEDSGDGESQKSSSSSSSSSSSDVAPLNDEEKLVEGDRRPSVTDFMPSPSMPVDEVKLTLEAGAEALVERCRRASRETEESRRLSILKDAEIRELQWKLEKAEIDGKQWRLREQQSREKSLRLTAELAKAETRVTELQEELLQATERMHTAVAQQETSRNSYRMRIAQFEKDLESAYAVHSEREAGYVERVHTLTQSLELCEEKYLKQSEALRITKENWEKAHVLIEELQAEKAEQPGAHPKMATSATWHISEATAPPPLGDPAATPSHLQMSSHMKLQELLTLEGARSRIRELETINEQLVEQIKSASASPNRNNLDPNSSVFKELEFDRVRIVQLEDLLLSTQNACNDLEATKMELEKKYCESQIEIRRLLKYKSDLEKHLAQILTEEGVEGNSNESASFFSSVQELVTENSALKEELEKSKGRFEAEVEDLRQRTEAELSDTRAALEALERQYGEMAENFKKKNERLLEEKYELLAQHTELSGELRRRRGGGGDGHHQLLESGENWENEKSNLVARVGSASSVIEQLTQQLTEAKSEATRAAMQIASKDGELQFCKSQLDREANRSQYLLDSVNDLQQELQIARSESTSFSKEIETLKQNLKSHDDIKQELSRRIEQLEWAKGLVQEEANIVSQELTSARQVHNEKITALELQVNRLELALQDADKENGRLNAELDHMQQQISGGAHGSPLKAAEAALPPLKEENAKLLSQISELKLQVAQQEAQIHSQNSTLSILREQFHTFYEHRGVRSLPAVEGDAPLADSLRQLYDLEHGGDGPALQKVRQEELEKANEEIRSLAEELEKEIELKWKVTVDQNEKIIEDLDERLRVRDQQISESTERIGNLSQELLQLSNQGVTSNALEAKDAELATLREQMAILTSEVETAKMEVETARQTQRLTVQAHTLDIGRLQSTIDENQQLTQSVRSIVEEHQKLEQRFAKERAEFELILKEKNSELRKLEQEKRFHKDEAEKLGSDFQKQLHESVSGGDYEGKLKVAMSRCNQLARGKVALESECDSLRVEIVQLQAKTIALEKRCESLDEHNKGLGQKLSQATKRLSGNEDSGFDLNEEVARLRHRMITLQDELETKRVVAKDLENALTAERNSSLPLRRSLDMLERTNQELERLLESAKEETKSWQHQYQELLSSQDGQQALSDIQAKVLSHEEALRQKQEEVEMWQQRCRDAARLTSLKQEEIAKANASIQSLQNELAAKKDSDVLEQQNSELLGKLEAQKRANELLRRQTTSSGTSGKAKPSPSSISNAVVSGTAQLHIPGTEVYLPAVPSSSSTVSPRIVKAILAFLNANAECTTLLKQLRDGHSVIDGGKIVNITTAA